MDRREHQNDANNFKNDESKIKQQRMKDVKEQKHNDEEMILMLT